MTADEHLDAARSLIEVDYDEERYYEPFQRSLLNAIRAVAHAQIAVADAQIAAVERMDDRVIA